MLKWLRAVLVKYSSVFHYAKGIKKLLLNYFQPNQTVLFFPTKLGEEIGENERNKPAQPIAIKI